MEDLVAEPDQGGLCMAVVRDGDAVVRLSGVLCADNAESVRARLAGLLRDADCVVVDLDDVEIAHPAVLGVLASALHEARGWPVAKLAVLAPRPATRRALAEAEVDRFVVIIAAADDATEACDRRPAEVRATWRLPAAVTSPGRARQMLGDRLHLWGCPARFVADAVQLVNELVTNVVEHAGTEAKVAVHLEDGVLLCSVRDHSTAPPVPRRPAEAEARGGFGLLLVDALARNWGWIPQPDGKTVWAATAPPDEPPGPARRPPAPLWAL